MDDGSKKNEEEEKEEDNFSYIMLTDRRSFVCRIFSHVCAVILVVRMLGEYKFMHACVTEKI